MRRRDELVVGATILLALAVVVVGAVWLSQTRLGAGGELQTARFRTVGGLGVGNPVVLRGVRVGRVRTIGIGAADWVEAELQIYPGVIVPARPAVIAASASLFGEWQAEIISLDEPPDDPNVIRDLTAAGERGGDTWPGATLPDIGQLTAQAGRIATDIATVSSRISTAFDSQTVLEVQGSIRDFGQVADTISRFAERQTVVLDEMSTNLKLSSDVVTQAAMSLEAALGRLDSATAEGELDSILTNLQASSVQMRTALTGFGELVQAVNDNQASFIAVLQSADSVMSRLERMSGTLGLLVGDSTLYVQATDAVQQFRALLADIQENPRKYFKFSVF